jgi:predicted ribosome quality control (RQC) complex YloA/Tae2 family protein
MKTCTSPNGYTILVGRCARENEEITLRLAQPNDYWFHAKDGPGPHVLLQTSTPEYCDLVCAARLACPKGVVMYTQAVNVSKPKWSSTGTVHCSEFQTIVSTRSVERACSKT